jgi:hypothetical protein
MFLKSLVNSTVATRRALHKGALTMISSLFARKRRDFDECERRRRQSDWRGLLRLPSESTTTSSPTTIFDDKLSHDKLSEGNAAATMGVPTKSLTLKSAQQLASTVIGLIGWSTCSMGAEVSREYCMII